MKSTSRVSMSQKHQVAQLDGALLEGQPRSGEDFPDPESQRPGESSEVLYGSPALARRKRNAHMASPLHQPAVPHGEPLDVLDPDGGTQFVARTPTTDRSPEAHNRQSVTVTPSPPPRSMPFHRRHSLGVAHGHVPALSVGAPGPYPASTTAASPSELPATLPAPPAPATLGLLKIGSARVLAR